MTITPEMLVQREVFYCVSSLVSTLAQGAGGASDDLDLLAYQALDLASPIDDWEETRVEAEANGYRIVRSFDHPDTFEWLLYEDGEATDREGYFDTEQEALEAICAGATFEPYQREVFEHWIVSDWLADKLAEKGEKVDKDFAGLTVWARTTTGQGIASDSVIEAICADINKEG